MSEQPKVYVAVYEHRTDQLRRDVQQRLSSEASQAAHKVSGWVTEMIREAYVRGVSDGFAQGVEKASQVEAALDHGKQEEGNG